MTRKPNSMLKEDIILVHDYLIQMGGAERVVATMSKAFPEAPIYTSVTDRAGLSSELKNRKIVNSWLRNSPWILKYFKQYFLLYPLAFRNMRIPAKRAAWISTSTFSKHILAPPGMTTFCYCHNPTRFLWDSENYLTYEVGNSGVRRLLDWILPTLRKWDRDAADRMDYFVANSENVKKRIKAAYGRDCEVIHPPVDVERFKVSHRDDGYYLVLSRLVGYKGIDRAVEAFRGLNRTLHVVGDGTDRKRLEGLAGRNVKFFGRVSEAEIERQLANCRAVIFPGAEDFGIVPVEAQACGKPVIAFGAGGALETVVEGETGVFFRDPCGEGLRHAILLSETVDWDAAKIRRNAERFSEAVFLKKMIRFMEERLDGEGEAVEASPPLYESKAC